MTEIAGAETARRALHAAIDSVQEVTAMRSLMKSQFRTLERQQDLLDRAVPLMEKLRIQRDAALLLAAVSLLYALLKTRGVL